MAKSGGAIALRQKSELFINIATTKMIILNGNTAIQYGGAVSFKLVPLWQYSLK